MFGYTRLFRSRWSALLWAAGILYLAYDVAGSQPADDNSADAEAAQAAALANVF